MTSQLPWHFEAFREYLSYEVLKSAAAVLQIFENEIATPLNPKIQQMQDLLEFRTGKNSWIPKRSGSEDVNWDVEGDVYRNKGRLLTSMFVLEPKAFSEPPRVKLLPFGRALANGLITEKAFYDFIISRFKYPHPAWEDNWNKWTQANRELYPLAFILQVLLALDASHPDAAILSTQEAAIHLFPVSNHVNVNAIAKSILDYRKTSQTVERTRSDEVDRKINDIFGFLCISGYTYFMPNGQAIALNLRARHSTERTFFERTRKGENRLQEIKTLVELVEKNHDRIS